MGRRGEGKGERVGGQGHRESRRSLGEIFHMKHAQNFAIICSRRGN